jgi:hypothetical protein
MAGDSSACGRPPRGSSSPIFRCPRERVNSSWWKDSNGKTGQVPESEARKGPLATVAVVANRFGMDGWELVEVISQPHSIYRLVFELAYVMEDEVDEQQDEVDEQPALMSVNGSQSEITVVEGK